MDASQRIVITGLAPICGAGVGQYEVWDNILGKKLGLNLKRVVINGKKIDEYYQHSVRKIELSDFIKNRNKLSELKEWRRGAESSDLNFMLASIQLAIKDSKLPIDRHVGLLISHENPGLEDLVIKLALESHGIKSSCRKNFVNYFRKLYELTERDAYETQSFMMLYHVSKIFNIQGYSLVINNACSSGLYAIEAASQSIRSGLSGAMIIAASDFPQIFKQMWLRNMGLYAKDGKIKPFAKNRDGFVLGEGATAIIVESYESAQKRKARIYAEYLGGHFLLEAWKVSLPAVNERFYQETMINALEKCHLKTGNIDLIGAHGLGTQVGDRYESNAISEVFGERTPPVVAFKPYVGHSLGCSALIETTLLIMSMYNKIVPPIINCGNIDERLYINIVRERMNLSDKCLALKISHSFGGYLAAIVLSTKRSW